LHASLSCFAAGCLPTVGCVDLPAAWRASAVSTAFRLWLSDSAGSFQWPIPHARESAFLFSAVTFYFATFHLLPRLRRIPAFLFPACWEPV